MISNLNSKTIALGLMSFCAAGAIGIGVEVTKGALFAIRSSIADLELAKAANLEAANKLRGTLETAAVANNVGRMQAEATVASAKLLKAGNVQAAEKQADGAYRAAAVEAYAENAQYAELMKPVIVTPMQKVVELNDEITRIKLGLAHPSANSGSVPFNGAPPEMERALCAVVGCRIQPSGDGKLKQLEVELESVKQSASKSLGDAGSILVSATNQMFDLGSDPVFGICTTTKSSKPCFLVPEE